MSDRWIDYDKIHYYLNEKDIEDIKEKYKKLFSIFNINYKENNILEVGCGHGIMSLIFIGIFKSMLCIDKEKHLIDTFNEKIKEDNILNIETKKVCCSKFKNDNKFNIIIFTFSFVWMDNKKKCLNNILKYLNKDGYLLIIEPFSYLNELNNDNKDKDKMMESINILLKNKKIKLLYLCEIDRGINYLFKKIN